MKACRMCGEVKQLEDFHKHPTTKDKRTSACKLCLNTRDRIRGRKNRKPGKYPGSIRGKAQALRVAARIRARDLNLDMTLSIEWVQERLENGMCEVTGLPLKIGAGPRTALSASIDRTDPQKGYTPDNAKVVCWAYNAAKGEGTHEDVVMLAKAVLNVC